MERKTAVTVTVTAAADELYASPLDAFVEKRKALAKALRDAGDAAGAKQLGAMAKPPITAWVVNHLWWTERGAFDALIEAAGALRKSPDSRPEFDRRMRAMRDRARDVLEGAGHAAGAPLLRRVGTTLHAIAVAGSFAPDENGRLVADREAPGFEAMEGAAWPTRPKAPSPAALARSEDRARPARPVRPTRDEDAERREAEAQAQAQARAKLQQELEEARKQVEQHAAAVARADKELEAVDAERARLDGERRRVEAAKARAEDLAARGRQRVAEIERALRGRPRP